GDEDERWDGREARLDKEHDQPEERDIGKAPRSLVAIGLLEAGVPRASLKGCLACGKLLLAGCPFPGLALAAQCSWQVVNLIRPGEDRLAHVALQQPGKRRVAIKDLLARVSSNQAVYDAFAP